MTPLISHIVSEMSGVIITVFLLFVAFALAFWYLFRTVSKMRTLEEMKDDFVSNMTHELKTPIAIAYSANDALLNYDTDNDPDKRKKYLMIANKQLKRLGELVENILARRTREGRRYARLRRGHRAEKDGGRRGTKRRGDRRAVRCERRKVPRRGKRAARGVPLRRRENRRMLACTGKGRVK